MDKGACWVTVHGVAESDMTEQLTLSLLTFREEWVRQRYLIGSVSLENLD